MISPLAYVDPSAKLGKNVSGSSICLYRQNVEIGVMIT